ncbi:hypothetical protein F2Q65_09325 [Thiohalocapsa marina]|uniref:Uncharacterized protein n=1 Tax=Thiohalocapsa marina TaxID=424902 RepID=A0A5M8FMS1_9GAMM|nr:hypothetical protein [Thiohalocapsa marina]KAA6185290.1 hypothetical protein F2Q65_09325 [Thiohalocapsa marina]
MKAVIDQARAEWATYIPAQQAQERQALVKRRKAETIYRISPFAQPQLADVIVLWAPLRDANQLKTADDRLTSLGFQRTKEGNVVAWIDDRADCIVYANPLAYNRIDFEVWRKPLPELDPRRPPQPVGSFYFLDTYIKNLPGKYASRLAKAMSCEP